MVDTYVEYIEFLSNRAKLEPLEDIAKGILHTHCENEQQADFLSLAKAEMDTLRTENAAIKKRVKSAESDWQIVEAENETLHKKLRVLRNAKCPKCDFRFKIRKLS